MFVNQSEVLLSEFWKLLEGDPAFLRQVTFSGSQQILPSVYDVTSFASASIAAANLASAELKLARSGSHLSSLSVSVDRLDACAAFIGEGLFQPIGWEMPPLWDPIAGNYLTKDQKWIRLHTNYSYHRDAVLTVLKVDINPESVKRAVASWTADELELAVVTAGGCAAVMRTKEEWSAHPQGMLSKHELPVQLTRSSSATARFEKSVSSDAPLKGVRVLDLTRVIAGPECTRFLSSQGADVLRIDPPGFQEVPALLPETTLGKRRAFLDLSAESGQKTFVSLIEAADVFVYGLRPGALTKFGFDSKRLSEINPALVIANHNVYGWQGEWKQRRGFDSLVQMSCGINAAGAAQKNRSEPFPLPAQALDHGIGFLLAAGVCRALSELYQTGRVCHVRGSLIGAANALMQTQGDFHKASPSKTEFESVLVEDQTAWGLARRVRSPGLINGTRADWNVPAGQLGVDAPKFQ